MAQTRGEIRRSVHARAANLSRLLRRYLTGHRHAAGDAHRLSHRLSDEIKAIAPGTP